MLAYLVRRLMLAVLTVWAVSVLSFVVIQLPPGDYITSYIAQMSASGSFVSQQDADALRHEYGLDRPVWVQYLRWMRLVLVLMYLGFKLFNANIGGLFADEFAQAPWSWAKAWDLAKHLPLPALILGLA